MTEKKSSVLLNMTVFLLGTGMFYFGEGEIYVGSFGVMYKYLFGIVLIALGALRFLTIPNLDEGKRLSADAFVLALPYMVTVFFSMILWIRQNSPVNHMTRGFFFAFYQIIALLVAVSYHILFGKKGLYMQLLSMVGANVIIILMNIKDVGVVAFLQDYFLLISTFAEDTSELMKEVEVHDLTFAMGAYLMYFLLAQNKIKHRLMLIMVTFFFFSVGLKRIAVGALAVGLLVAVFSREISDAGKIVSLRITGYFVILLSVGYIAAIKLGFYNTVAALLGVNTKGRTEINTFINSYYTFSPLFFGYGLGYVSRLMSSGVASKVTSATALHNDFLRMYLEVGFWGYLLWIWTSWGYKIGYFCKRRSFQMAMMTVALFLYCFITYTTDNTYYYYYINIAVFTLVISHEYEEGMCDL